jgi:hypothetical protein
MLEYVFADTIIILLAVAISFIILGFATMLNNYLEDKYKKKSIKDTHYYYLIKQNKNKSGGF